MSKQLLDLTRPKLMRCWAYTAINLAIWGSHSETVRYFGVTRRGRLAMLGLQGNTVTYFGVTGQTSSRVLVPRLNNEEVRDYTATKSRVLGLQCNNVMYVGVTRQTSYICSG